MALLFQEIASQARFTLDDRLPEQLMRDAWDSPMPSLKEFLVEWCAASPKPLVLLLDEIDSLVGDTLITVLRQLRAGYPERPARFPSSIVLCGVRDVRDYRLRSDDGKTIITGGSAFNVRAESVRLGDFSRDEVDAHAGTALAGQRIGLRDVLPDEGGTGSRVSGQFGHGAAGHRKPDPTARNAPGASPSCAVIVSQ